MIYANPNQPGAVVEFKSKHLNYIGGEWVAPVQVVLTWKISVRSMAKSFCEVARRKRTFWHWMLRIVRFPPGQNVWLAGTVTCC